MLRLGFVKVNKKMKYVYGKTTICLCHYLVLWFMCILLIYYSIFHFQLKIRSILLLQNTTKKNNIVNKTKVLLGVGA